MTFQNVAEIDCIFKNQSHIEHIMTNNSSAYSVVLISSKNLQALLHY